MWKTRACHTGYMFTVYTDDVLMAEFFELQVFYTLLSQLMISTGLPFGNA